MLKSRNVLKPQLLVVAGEEIVLRSFSCSRQGHHGLEVSDMQSTSWALVQKLYAGVERKQEDCYCAAGCSVVSRQARLDRTFSFPVLAHVMPMHGKCYNRLCPGRGSYESYPSTASQRSATAPSSLSCTYTKFFLSRLCMIMPRACESLPFELGLQTT